MLLHGRNGHVRSRPPQTDRAAEAANRALQRLKSKAAGGAVFFELFDEDTAGVRPEALAEPRSQERVLRRIVEHIVDFVRFAPMVQIPDAPVPQMVEQLPDILHFFDTLTPDPEQVIEVPRSCPMMSPREPLFAIRSWRSSWWKSTIDR